MKKIHVIVCALLIVAATLATVIYYPDLPLTIPVHWSVEGTPDGYGPRGILWLLGPGLMGAMLMWKHQLGYLLRLLADGV